MGKIRRSQIIPPLIKGKKIFPYGTQYLRGETPAMDQWEDDFRTMASMGVNTIRVWLLWNRLEPQEGLIDTSYLDILFELGDRYKIGIGCLFHLHAALMGGSQNPFIIIKILGNHFILLHGSSILLQEVGQGLCLGMKVQKVTLDFIDA